MIRQWVASVYHHTAHAGLCVPQLPQASFSPAEMFEVGLARAGTLRLPARPGLAYDFLAVVWRTIQHYGVEIHGQRYNGPGLNLHRGHRSPFSGVHAGKWPFHVDVSDVRHVHFRDPDTGDWHRLVWEHAHGMDGPFSQAAADYARQVSVRTHRHVDPQQAVHDLLGQWSAGEVTARRDRALARRLSAQRAAEDATDTTPAVAPAVGTADATTSAAAATAAAREVASLPGVVDLVARRSERARRLEVVDDVDVFAQYYAEHPDADGLEVFDE
ncbi:hypothetical protein WDZ17_17325 [Pseudokineococcus basanitobsidens]|uniref:Uncharacterized protein n=1 Tax=Pseudokineococcus basanitobsidens TaxID=1926649 RepID=A0ABU8RPT8_9ACTN